MNIADRKFFSFPEVFNFRLSQETERTIVKTTLILLVLSFLTEIQFLRIMEMPENCVVREISALHTPALPSTLLSAKAPSAPLEILSPLRGCGAAPEGNPILLSPALTLTAFTGVRQGGCVLDPVCTFL